MNAKKIISVLLCLVLAASMLAGCGGAGNSNDSGNVVPADNTENNTNNIDPVPAISEEEMSKLIVLPADGLEPVGADKLNEGGYDISVLSGSEQFRIKSSKLMVVGNALQLVIDVEGTAYSKMVLGKAADAASASAVDGEPNDNGGVTFRIPVKSLNEVIECAAYADEYGKWFDRTLLAKADSLDASAIKPAEVPDDTGKDDKQDDKKSDDKKSDDKKSDGKKSDDKKSSGGSTMKDGDYKVDVAFSGGTGKAKIESPATLHVKKGKMTVTVVWTSKYYDYMKVGGKKYMNENKGGYSTFTFPISALGKSMKVIGDTTAMSTPHEVEYTVKFTLKK